MFTVPVYFVFRHGQRRWGFRGIYRPVIILWRFSSLLPLSEEYYLHPRRRSWSQLLPLLLLPFLPLIPLPVLNTDQATASIVCPCLARHRCLCTASCCTLAPPGERSWATVTWLMTFAQINTLCTSTLSEAVPDDKFICVRLEWSECARCMCSAAWLQMSAPFSSRLLLVIFRSRLRVPNYSSILL